MRSLDAFVQQCVESRFGLACVRFDHVQLLYKAALKFDATFNVLVLALDVGKRFARLITHALRDVLRTRLGVNRTSYDTLGSKKPAMSFEDDLRRVEEHVAEARRFVQQQKGLTIRLTHLMHAKHVLKANFCETRSSVSARMRTAWPQRGC